MFNSTSDENISVSDVHIGLDTSHDLEYIEEEDYTNSTFEDLNNHTTRDYCQVNYGIDISVTRPLFQWKSEGPSYESHLDVKLDSISKIKSWQSNNQK